MTVGLVAALALGGLWTGVVWLVASRMARQDEVQWWQGALDLERNGREDMRVSREQWVASWDALHDRFLGAKRERDEAREGCKRLRLMAGGALADRDAAEGRARDLDDRLNVAIARYQAAETERDEDRRRLTAAEHELQQMTAKQREAQAAAEYWNAEASQKGTELAKVRAELLGLIGRSLVARQELSAMKGHIADLRPIRVREALLGSIAAARAALEGKVAP